MLFGGRCGGLTDPGVRRRYVAGEKSVFIFNIFLWRFKRRTALFNQQNKTHVFYCFTSSVPVAFAKFLLTVSLTEEHTLPPSINSFSEVGQHRTHWGQREIGTHDNDSCAVSWPVRHSGGLKSGVSEFYHLKFAERERDGESPYRCYSGFSA